MAAADTDDSAGLRSVDLETCLPVGSSGSMG